VTQSLDFAFYGEGKREYLFLQPLLERAISNLLPTIDVQALNLDWVKVGGLSQVEKMQVIAAEASGAVLLIFHLDSDFPSFERSFEERFRPGYEQLRNEAQHFPEKYNLNIVPVIPIRMIDAWLLVDFNAFQRTIGTDYSAKELNFPIKPQDVEGIADPKAIFEQAVKTCSRRRKKSIWPEELWPRLAALIDLRRLAQVSAYVKFSNHLTDTLHLLKYV